MYGIWKLTAHRGRKGRFSATLRMLKVPQSTAWDLVTRHRIAIGEIPDDEANDDRDELEEPEPGESDSSESESSDNEESGSGGSKRTRPRVNNRPRRTVSIVISGELANAIDALRAFYHWGNDKEAIKKTVLRAYLELTVPMLPAPEPEQEQEQDEETAGEQDAA
jgi:hypothetical protein